MLLVSVEETQFWFQLNNIYNNNGGLYVDYGARNIIFNGNVIKKF